jgi:hypothetical protein
MAKSTGSTAFDEAEAAVLDLAIEANVVPPMRQTNDVCIANHFHHDALNIITHKKSRRAKENFSQLYRLLHNYADLRLTSAIAGRFILRTNKVSGKAAIATKVAIKYTSFTLIVNDIMPIWILSVSPAFIISSE